MSLSQKLFGLSLRPKMSVASIFFNSRYTVVFLSLFFLQFDLIKLFRFRISSISLQNTSELICISSNNLKWWVECCGVQSVFECQILYISWLQTEEFASSFILTTVEICPHLDEKAWSEKHHRPWTKCCALTTGQSGLSGCMRKWEKMPAGRKLLSSQNNEGT